MPSKWVKVSPSEAAQHRLYGIRGWLLLFVAGLVLAPPISLGHIAGLARLLGTSVSDFLWSGFPSAVLIDFALVADVLVALVTISFLVNKSPCFRPVTTAALLLASPLSSLVALGYVGSENFPGAAMAIAQSVGPWLVTGLGLGHLPEPVAPCPRDVRAQGQSVCRRRAGPRTGGRGYQQEWNEPRGSAATAPIAVGCRRLARAD